MHEIRSVQDFYVKNALQFVSGVSEVASIGGYVKEYQVDVDPERMRHYKLSLNDIVKAVKECNIDVGAKTLEINKVEYFVRGIGYVNNVEDIENSPIKSGNSIPIRIKDVAKVVIGPAERRGILDKEGAEVVGGVIVSRYGENPMETIAGVKQKIVELTQSMPSKVLDNGQKSKLTIIPFYDRSELINKTLGTLKNALSFEVLITLFVIILMLRNLRVSLLVGSLMPMTVLTVFAVMKLFDVEANIVALSGIAIAIGTVVDMGIILSENIVRHLELNPENSKIDQIVGEATQEVSGAILTAALTTIISFVPVFMLTGAEGKMFMPLAFTKPPRWSLRCCSLFLLFLQ